ncbi:MAG: exodeoxyribonuclease VII large subunit [Clostridia bacterium]|nr:exodeoxyribonuclease VII large subunit [Clostridia bacterium]
MEQANAVSVSQLNRYLKQKFDSDANLFGIWIKGEISNFTNHMRTGHFYMSLKDDGGVIKAIMFSGKASKLAFVPEDGMKVLCKGRVSVYEQGGSYQLYIDEMIPDGVGALYIAYEQLKNKLESEGLFASEHKKRLPKIPYRVGVITSPTGAAVRDIINVITRRFPLAEIVLYPALVQGENGAASLVEAVKYFDITKSVNVIIIGRGGGSIEDLWAFNDETLARTIYDCTIPVISAVGHETDFTICDFVSDLRAPTPSAAAELCVPDSNELIEKFSNLKNTVLSYTRRTIKEKRLKLDTIAEHRIFKEPAMLIDDRKNVILNIAEKIDTLTKISTERKKNAFLHTVSKLEALSPLAVLSRGYAYATSGENIIRSVDDIVCGDKINVVFSNGSATATVNEINKRK